MRLSYTVMDAADTSTCTAPLPTMVATWAPMFCMSIIKNGSMDGGGDDIQCRASPSTYACVGFCIKHTEYYQYHG